MEVAVIQSLARRLVALLIAARSAERARASRQGCRRRHGLLGIVAGMSAGSGAASARPSNPAMHEAARGRDQPAPDRLRIAPPAARSTRRCASCRGRSATPCTRSTASAARSTTSLIPAGRGRRGWRSSPNGATRSTTSIEGKIGGKVAGLAGPVRDFGLRREDFLAVIDGMEMDAREDIRAPSFATLDLYCDRVASAVGRLSVRAFGVAARRRQAACRTISAAPCS